ncbi:hypothetical protein AM500_06180 [Bacillus sp. FJAT-18017]|uniref:response regulator transcription factor n=1 Tax=Bacillus sp. FJAT-18017 TaxID=1705566 RepID=UPI0006AF6EE2|nr:response regulator transcription factor [Bacillus sp. FJAT-18017]ALC89417.1 hypothetical protein AM500_06180 [Bacillus sp. FJAT-18017]
MGKDGLYRVMIVDDEMLIREGIKHYIDWEQEGFEIVAEAANGREALDLLEMARPHIILTDIVMPIMDGEELTKIVKQHHPEIEVIILSSFGDFDYVRAAFQHGAVDYILKPKLDGPVLIEVLEKTADRIQSSGKMKERPDDGQTSIGEVINKILSGYKVDLDDPEVSFLFPYKGYCLAGFKAGDGSNHALLFQELEASLKTALGNCIVFRFPEGKDAVNFLIHTEFDWNAILHSVEAVVMSLKLENGDPSSTAGEPQGGERGLYAAVGSYFTNLENLGGIQRDELDRLLNFHFYFSKLGILTPAIFEKEAPQPPEFSVDVFTAELRQRNFDAAFMSLKQHAVALTACYTMDIFEFKAFFSNTIFNMAIILGNMGFDIKGLDQAKYQYLRLIDQAQTAGEVLGLLNRFLEVVSASIELTPHASSSLNMKSIRQYIVEHYQEPLTLTDVAAHFHFNPSYLSSYFSANNDESFTEYLNKIRIEEAAKLLTAGSEPISEISARVGYSDHSYFCKVFKKLKGVSPSQYKRKYLVR